jgi:hypothetical protein
MKTGKENKQETPQNRNESFAMEKAFPVSANLD